MATSMFQCYGRYFSKIVSHTGRGIDLFLQKLLGVLVSCLYDVIYRRIKIASYTAAAIEKKLSVWK